MKNTNLQNCQRITLMMELLIIVMVVTFQTIRLVKKKIDVKSKDERGQQPPTESATQKYRQSQISQQKFDKAAVNQTIFNDEDTCTQRLIKKICEFNFSFHPMLIAFPLNFILGRSMPFQVSIFFICLVSCFLFNVFKVHRARIEAKQGRLCFELIWWILSILLLVNLITTNSSSMLYLLKE